MPKDLADHDKASTLAKQLASQGVPQPMRAHVRKSGPKAGTLDDITDQVRPDGPRGARQVRNT